MNYIAETLDAAGKPLIRLAERLVNVMASNAFDQAFAVIVAIPLTVVGVSLIGLGRVVGTAGRSGR